MKKPDRYDFVNTLDLSPRTINALENANIHYYGSLMDCDVKELIGKKGFGKATMKDISKYRSIGGYVTVTMKDKVLTS